jgi:hypothetical protein
VKLFNLEMKDNDPMALSSEIKAIMHDVDATGVKIDIALTTFIKVVYPTYSHCLESLQANGQLESLNFDTSVEKIAKCEMAFGKKTAQPTGETVCLAKKGKNQSHDSSRGEGSKRGREKKNFRGGGGGSRHNQGERSDLHYIRCGKNGYEAKTCRIPWEKIEEKQKQKEEKGKALNPLILLLLTAILA